MHCRWSSVWAKKWKPCRRFGAQVSSEVAKAWKRAGKKHPVSLTELYAVCVARHVWKHRLDNCKCVCFIDNQGDVDALIKGYSSEDTMKSLWSSLKGWTAPSRFCLGSSGSRSSQTSRVFLPKASEKSCARICQTTYLLKQLACLIPRNSIPFLKTKSMAEGNGEKQRVVCEANFKVQKRSAGKATCALKKQSAFLFDRGIEKTQKVVPKVSNRKTSRSSVEHPQSFSRALGKHWPSLIRRTSAVNIYIYLLYSLHICCFYSYRGDSLTYVLDL